MKIIHFQPEHLDIFDWRENERLMYNTGSDLTRRLTAAMQGGADFVAWTLVHDGRILVIGGIFKISEKTGYCWTIFSRWAEQSPLSAARIVRRKFTTVFDAMGLHRVTTFNLVEAAVHHRWCKWLGFVAEGQERKFDDEGRDYIRFGLVRDGS